ncbi:MAG: hypothetical protein GEV03_27000 [Streptosporangiales bacterium]|nr:hypothetical protein [Streptosporangiales bacterium]
MATHSYPGLLARGAGAGAIAGVAAGMVSLFVVETQIRAALAVEEARNAGAVGHEEMFSRGVQVVGGVAAVVVVGIALGAVFATAFAAVHRHLPGGSDFGRSVALAAVGFAAVGLLPAIKYPANPPGVGQAETVNDRTVLYFSLILGGLIIAYGVGRLHGLLAARTSWPAPWRATAVAAAAAAAVIAVLLVWPAGPDAVPPDVPATLLWRFRLASLAEVLTLWAVLGVAFGLLTEAPKSGRGAEAGNPDPVRGDYQGRGLR